MRDSNRKLSIRLFLTIGPYEEDERFKELLRSLAQRTLFIYALLGIILVVIYVLSHIYIRGETISWNVFGLSPDDEILIIDKVLIIILCLILILISRVPASLNTIRGMVFGIAWFSNLAMMVPDIATQDISFTTPYTTICILFAIAVVPYKGWHTALLCLAMIITTESVIEFVPEFLEMESLDHKLGNLIYIYAVSIFLTFMTSQIYVNRYEQYSAHKQVEELKNQLEERANVLLMLKEKSDDQAEKILENEKLKDRFFANISHEFRTPLTLILGPLNDLLDEHPDTEKPRVHKEALRLMQKNANRLLKLINQLLDLSKIDAGHIHIRLQDTDLASLVRETVLSFSAMAESRKIDLSYSIEEDHLFARVDPEQMERVISNLLSNALKFTPENGRVSVSVSQSDTAEGSIRIKVSDTGIGIPAEDLPNIFDRFYQADQKLSSNSTGTGIGLALVKEIVELHGGTVHVRSKPGQGTEFIIHLYDVSEASDAQPLPKLKSGKRDLGATEEANPPLDKVPGQNLDKNKEAPLIMLVDDNPDILAYLYSHLSERYRVILKERSSEALKAISNNSVDLVISDLMMPEPDGFELCRTIKENPDLNHIPVILLTAQADEEQRLEGLELGADDYISKPFSANELMARVENLIEIRRKLKEKFSEQLRLKGKEVEVSSADARFLKRVQSVIEKHMENSNFGVDWLADEVALSTRQLQRKIRAITDLSAGGYIRLIRLEHASQLLKQEWGNVSEIAYKVGFQDAKYFSRLFKQTFGKTPSEWVEKE